MINYGGALYLGALITSSLVPPTSGPVSAVALLKVPLGQAMYWGLIVSLPAILGGVVYLRTLKAQVAPKEEYSLKKKDYEKLPSVGKSFFSIIIPLSLIMLNTFISVKYQDASLADFIAFIGDPLMALLIGVLSSILILRPGLEREVILNDWVKSAINMSAMPIMIKGLGGSFGDQDFIELGMSYLKNYKNQIFKG